MSNWVEVVEEGQIYYINEELGNIVKVTDTMYVSMVPKVLRFGPFSSLEEAKKIFEKKSEIELALNELNSNLTKK